MLTNLTINNIVLIEKLEIDCKEGLTVLTGETGAGKSILLDALGLALGMRGSISVIRKGEDKASVSASFVFNKKNISLIKILKDLDIDINTNELILRRTIHKDGKSKAFINDNLVNIATLKKVACNIAEIHGQFETSGLLQVKSHRNILDKYAQNEKLLAEVQNAWNAWQKILQECQQVEKNIQKNKEDYDYIKYMVTELEKLSPKDGEEKELLSSKQKIKNAEKISTTLKEADYIISSDEGIEMQLAQLRGKLEKLASSAELTELDTAIKAIERAEVEVGEAVLSLNNLASSIYVDEDISLDAIEERLFALKDCARKHNCQISELPEKLQELKQELSAIENSDDILQKLKIKEKFLKQEYLASATKLSKKRKIAAEKFIDNLLRELPSLKLDKVKFTVAIDKIEDESNWGDSGIDKVEFRVAMNIGQSPAPLQKAASGGELARLMLAFKVVLAKTDMIDIMIFDEIDAGIGGAVADAVGGHLQQLAKTRQVLVITHSPQVAAKANHHLKITKTQNENTITHVKTLKSIDEKCEEIARMLAGQKITKEARAAALSLLEQKEGKIKEKVA